MKNRGNTGNGMKTDKGESPLILRQHFNAVADAYCVLLQNPQNDNDFTVAWKSRHCDKLVEPKKFKAHDSAIQHFNRVVHTADIPLHKNIANDWQADSVYTWEHEHLSDQAKEIDVVQAHKLLRKVSRDYKIKPPNLIWKRLSPNGGSEYNSDHEIKFGHRDNISLLHEMTHAILHKKNISWDVPDHSPAFVWMAIELYNRYAHVDLQHLVTTAAKADILGDMKAEGKTNALSLAVRPNV
jgi:hypothetical protein